MSLKDILPDIGKIQMGMQVNQLSALLVAVLDAQGGSVTLTPEQVTKVHEGAKLNYESHTDGSLTLSLAE